MFSFVLGWLLLVWFACLVGFVCYCLFCVLLLCMFSLSSGVYCIAGFLGVVLLLVFGLFVG